MKKKKYTFKLTWVTLCTLSSIWAGDYAGMSGSFLRMGTTARSIAMGSAFTAEMDYGFTAYHNPATVSLLNSKQISFSYQGLSLGRQFNAAAIAFPLPPTGGLGISWVGSGVSNIDGRTSSGEHTGSMHTSENAFMFSFSQHILSWISVGINVKILRQQLPMNSDNLTGSGTGVDLGFLLYPESPWKMALMIQDLNSSYQWNTGQIFDQGRVYKESFPTIYRLGTTYSYRGLYFTGDAGYITDHKYGLGYSLRAGVEYQYKDHYFLRAGFGNQRAAGGIGMDYSLLKQNDSHLDYAFVVEYPAGIAHVITYALEF